MKEISLIVCTYNRCESLANALESVARSVVPDSIAWEVLVIDNNSRDKTKEAVEQFVSRFPGRFYYIFEPKQGLSNARNAGIAAANGRAIAFTDDDVTVHPDWLRNLTKPLLDDKCVGTAGRILLGEFQAPTWLGTSGPGSLVGALAHFDRGNQLTFLDEPPFGASMAFQRSVFQRFGGFRTDLGRSGKNLIGNEDTEFGNRLLSANQRILYVPSAVIYHPVIEERLRKQYFLTYHFDQGRALIRERGDRAPVGFVPRSFISISNRVLKILPRRVWWWIKEPNPQIRFFNRCRVWNTAGEIVEICHRSFAFNGRSSANPAGN